LVGVAVGLPVYVTVGFGVVPEEAVVGGPVYGTVGWPVYGAGGVVGGFAEGVPGGADPRFSEHTGNTVSKQAARFVNVELTLLSR